jgi:hypothetical protein
MPMRHGFQFAENLQQLIATEPTYQYRASPSINPVELENILCQVNTEYLDLHCYLLSIVLFAILPIGEGEPSIPLSGNRSRAASRCQRRAA